MIFLRRNRGIREKILTKRIPNIYSSRAQENIWRDGRAVECTGLENRQGESLPGFESLSLRHIHIKKTPFREFFTKLYIYYSLSPVRIKKRSGAPTGIVDFFAL